MSYKLEGLTIRKPNAIEIDNSTQVAQNRTLSGNVTRDYFGSNKSIYILDYQSVNVTDYNTINAIYQDYLTLGIRAFDVNETNLIIDTIVHIDLLVRKFSIQGSSYLSDFTLTLTEA